jgi:hypothetical protein
MLKTIRSKRIRVIVAWLIDKKGLTQRQAFVLEE